MLVDDPHAHALGLGLEALAHEPAGLGPGRRGPLVGVVVGLVADERPVRLVRERHAGLDEVVETPQRADALDQGRVAVAAAERRQRPGEVLGRVRHARAGAHLVVRLLVRAAHAAGAKGKPAGDDEHALRGVGNAPRAPLRTSCTAQPMPAAPAPTITVLATWTGNFLSPTVNSVVLMSVWISVPVAADADSKGWGVPYSPRRPPGATGRRAARAPESETRRRGGWVPLL